MMKHLMGLVGMLVGLVVLAIGGLIVNAMLGSIPRGAPPSAEPAKKAPVEVSVGLIPEPKKVAR